MFNKIVLGVDGSEHALHAARKAGELARALKSETLWVVVAFEPVPTYLGQPNQEHIFNARLKEADEILQNAIQTVGKIPGKLEKEVLEGTPAEAIINVAGTRNSDLIIMGARGLGRLAGLVLGSQVQKVVSHAHCPVLIVR